VRIDARADQRRLFRGIRGKIAFVRHAVDGIAEADRVQNLGGRREQRTDAHRKFVPRGSQCTTVDEAAARGARERNRGASVNCAPENRMLYKNQDIRENQAAKTRRNRHFIER